LEQQEQVLTPYDNYLYTLKAKETKRQYPHRLDKFFTFMDFNGTIEEKCTKLYEFSNKNNANASEFYLIKFIYHQKKRIYPQGEPVPVDYYNFLQCYECDSVYEVYELEKESQIKDVVETVDNPFDIGISFPGIDKRTSVGGKNARKKRERQKQLDDITDDDVKRALAKGHTLLSYSEH
jgi:hypothetical protein